MIDRSRLEQDDEDFTTLPSGYLTPYQGQARLAKWKGKFEVQKLFTLNQMRKCLTSHRRVEVAKSIFIYLAEHDVSGVRRLMGQARRDGLSMTSILGKLEQAVMGAYNAKGYSEDEFDLAILAMRLGGQSLLHALHRATGVPGATAVYAKMRERSVSETSGECLNHAAKHL